MIRGHVFQISAVAALVSGCAYPEFHTISTSRDDREIESMIQGKWYEEYLHSQGARILQPAILEFYPDGRVGYSFSSLAGDYEVRTSHDLFWRVEDRNLVFSDTPAGEPSMIGGVITKISSQRFDVYTTKSTFSRYYRVPKRVTIKLR
jgi:hypothetical protein